MSVVLDGDVLGLDLGTQRTGVARLHPVAKIAEPLPVIDMQSTPDIVVAVNELVMRYSAVAVVTGLPRGLDGQETEQTEWARAQTDLLKTRLPVPVFSIDEAGTTKKAEDRALKGESVDSVAAGVLLEDFITEVERGKVADVTI